MDKSRQIRLQATMGVMLGSLLLLGPLAGLALRHVAPLSHGVVAAVSVGGLFSVNQATLGALVGALLIYSSLYLYRCWRSARLACLVLSVVAIALLLPAHRQTPMLLILAIALAGWLAVSGALYTVRNDLVSLRFGLAASALLAGGALLYGFIGFLVAGPHLFHQHFSASQALTAALQAVFTLVDPVETTSQRAGLFLDLLGLLGAVAYGAAAFSLYKPVRFALTVPVDELARAKTVVAASSRSSEDFFKLWPKDKHYFFSASGRSFIAYRCVGRSAIMLGDPCGQSEEFSRLLGSFHRFARHNGWQLAAINSTEESAELFAARDFRRLFIGNEAIIDINQFVHETINSKHFRYVLNRAKREGLTTELWEQLDDSRLAELRRVSDAWLSHGGHKEYAFFNGYFAADYLRQCQVMVARYQGQVVAYVNSIPTYRPGDASIDHYRAVPEAPSVTMHFLMCELLLRLHADGARELNIGFAPLSGLEDNDENLRPAMELLLKVIKKTADRFYSFDGVEQFKRKFKPQWWPRYLYYEGSPASLLTVMRDIDTVSQPFANRRRRWRYVAGLILLAAGLILVQFL